ncbi:MAG: hypothetical protein J0M33_19790 [Anaerolineae bacterium]|nr:hypothetical protein [Anaerolineae bacterium]
MSLDVMFTFYIQQLAELWLWIAGGTLAGFATLYMIFALSRFFDRAR